MPTFTILRRQDAFVDYLAEVEAETPEQAARMAREAWERGPDLTWAQRSVAEFDANVFVALDEDGAEIEGSATGKLA